MSLPLIALAAALAAPQSTPIEAPGPLAPLKGSFVHPATSSGPILLVIPGSGPTDRDGNGPLGIRASTYRLLAQGLSQEGIGTVLIDKRGMFSSAPAVASANDVTVPDYVADTRAWIKVIRASTGAKCVWLLGHSEGGLVALVSAQEAPDICGLILVAAGGRKLGDVLREQFRSNPALAPILNQAEAAIAAFEQGKPVDLAASPGLAPIFPPQIHGFLRSLLSYDPAELISHVGKPILILQGDKDIQVGVVDARRLKLGSPGAELVLLRNTNHVLKTVESDDRQVNIATYINPDLPLAPGVVSAIAGFVAAHSGAKSAP
jgi:pimeloyl-ACP methyl ester carboxylesterase